MRIERDAIVAVGAGGLVWLVGIAVGLRYAGGIPFRRFLLVRLGISGLFLLVVFPLGLHRLAALPPIRGRMATDGGPEGDPPIGLQARRFTVWWILLVTTTLAYVVLFL